MSESVTGLNLKGFWTMVLNVFQKRFSLKMVSAISATRICYICSSSYSEHSLIILLFYPSRKECSWREISTEEVESHLYIKS